MENINDCELFKGIKISVEKLEEIIKLNPHSKDLELRVVVDDEIGLYILSDKKGYDLVSEDILSLFSSYFGVNVVGWHDKWVGEDTLQIIVEYQ